MLDEMICLTLLCVGGGVYDAKPGVLRNLIPGCQTQNSGGAEAPASKQGGSKNRLTACTSGSRSVGETSYNDYATLSRTRIVLIQAKGMVGG
jgi:hypothetical protein